jgi:hypothetical protein
MARKCLCAHRSYRNYCQRMRAIGLVSKTTGIVARGGRVVELSRFRSQEP